MFEIKKATRQKLKSRILLEGQAGSGKTKSALILARNLGSKIGVIDTEDNSACLYSEMCDFDVIDMKAPYTINNLIMAIEQLEKAQYDVIIVDSLSPFWASTGGALETVSRISKTQGKNSFTAWDDVTPLQNKLVDKILHCKAHILCTTRLKTDYVMEEYTTNSGKSAMRPVKVGLKTIQREGLDYEFTIVFRIDRNHIASVDKTRCSALDNYCDIITDQTAITLKNWLNDGEVKIDNTPLNNDNEPTALEVELNRLDQDPILKMNDDDMVIDFKNRTGALLNAKQIKLFMKQNHISVTEPDILRKFLYDNDLELTIAKFLEEVEK